mgnify:CR=1 FL=1
MNNLFIIKSYCYRKPINYVFAVGSPLSESTMRIGICHKIADLLSFKLHALPDIKCCINK